MLSMDRDSSREWVRRAIRIAGSQSALARACGVKQQHVWNWLNRDKQVPAKFVLLIEQATQKQVTRFQLRPDLFQPEEVNNNRQVLR